MSNIHHNSIKDSEPWETEKKRGYKRKQENNIVSENPSKKNLLETEDASDIQPPLRESTPIHENNVVDKNSSDEREESHNENIVEDENPSVDNSKPPDSQWSV